MDYGFGAVFGCPAHDQRDFDFAIKYDLEIIQVVSDGKSNSNLKEAFTGNGKLINSVETAAKTLISSEEI